MKMQWYTVYTKPYLEKKVSDSLFKKNIENYLPINRIFENYNFSERVINASLFNCYVFVKISEKQLALVKKVPGVVNLVYWLGKPVIVDETEIDSIKRFTNDHVNINIEKITLNSENSKGNNGSSLEDERPLISISQKKLKAVLPSLGYILTAEAGTSNVRIISPDPVTHQIKSGPSKLLSPVHSFYNFLKN